jgi:hypothetical protein
MSKNHKKSVYLKLYEEFNNKKKNKEKNGMNPNEINLKFNPNRCKKINRRTILENSKRLYNDYEKRKNVFNESEIKRLKAIKYL